MDNFKNLIELKDNQLFNSTMKKLVLGERLDFQEKSFILSCALLIINYLQQNKNNQQIAKEITDIIESNTSDKIRALYNTTQAQLKRDKKSLKEHIISSYEEEKAMRELAYYIVVRYSTLYTDYKPLYDFSVNLGYYPISRFIYENIWGNESENISLNHIFSDIHISQYEDSDKVLTFDQKNSTESLLENTDLYKAYVAPTSYGKSEFISQIIKNSRVQNIAIISPTKILVRQNATNIKTFLKSNPDLKYHIIYHHEMYRKNTNTIASFTQERGLRFLKEFPEQYFDYIIMDEAHELFSNKGRSHLL